MAKSQFENIFNWQSANPATGFLPNTSTAGNSIPSGVLSGTMATTATIYSNIIGCRQVDIAGIELVWTGTPIGTITIQVSNSGLNFTALTFSPGLTQPAGSANNIFVNLGPLGFKYFYIKYINASGSGVLTAYGQYKAFNS